MNKTPKSKAEKVKRPNQFQRMMIAMEKVGAVRRDGKSTAEEFNGGTERQRATSCVVGSSPTSTIIARMEAAQQRFGRLQLEDRKFPSLLQSAEDERRTRLNIGEYFDREMANRGDNGTLDYLSEEQGEKELGEGWRQ